MLCVKLNQIKEKTMMHKSRICSSHLLRLVNPCSNACLFL